jgi:eukaryotic-like serine/threonine-protein kinase
MDALSSYRFKEFLVDPQSRTLRTDDGIIPLTRRSFDLLLYLVQHPGQVLGKDELIKTIWADTFVDENSLAQSISVLRKALARKSEESACILTLPGRGYQFICSVEVIPNRNNAQTPANVTSKTAEVVAQSTAVAAEVAEIPNAKVSTHERTRVLLSPRFYLALLLLGAIGASGYFFWKRLHPAPQTIHIVLSEFENTAKDPDFDSTLHRALQIDLEQSPFIVLLPAATVRETLQQMQKKSDEPLTPELSREICQRNNYEVVLHGSIARIGNHYALILEASSCGVTGNVVAGYKAEVGSKDEVLNALDKASNQVRKQLGESATSLERFQTPITQATTPSLDALVAYSEGIEAADAGDLKGAQTLYERAISLDPEFASAYRALAISCYNLSDFNQASRFIQKAYNLRNRATERERIDIEIAYYYFGIHDFEAAARALKMQAQTYPNNSRPPARLCDLYTQLGEYKQAIEYGEEAYRLNSGYEVLARAYKRANQFDDAKRVANKAIETGADHWGIHSILFQIAFAEHDATKLENEGEWGLSHNEQSNMSLYNYGYAAASEGKIKESVNYLTRAYTDSLRNEDTDFANTNLQSIAEVRADVGDVAGAREALKKIKPSGKLDTELILLKAKVGDNEDAEHFVANLNPSTEKNTLHLYCYYPLIRAQLALNAHKPVYAVQMLEAARPYQLRDFEVPYLRAEAEDESGALDAAAADYRLILSNVGIDPISPLYYISHLRLARVLAKQNKISEADSEYKAFLAAWKDADPDQPLLIQAKAELQKLH